MTTPIDPFETEPLQGAVPSADEMVESFDKQASAGEVMASGGFLRNMVRVFGENKLAVISLMLAGGAGDTLHLWQKIGIGLYLVGALSWLWWFSKLSEGEKA
jgi:hypothetical protein